MGRTKEQALKMNYAEASTSRTMARAEPPPPPPQLEPNARGTRVLRGLTHEQLALVDVYKSENLIVGKYFDPSVLREFGFEHCKSVSKTPAMEQSIRLERTDIYSGYV